MNHFKVCDRCHQVDKEGFGGYKICEIRNTRIYTCFDCTELCDYCNKSPSMILHSNEPLRFACMECYTKIEYG